MKPRLLIITAILLAGLGAVFGTLGFSPPFARPDRAPVPTPSFGREHLEVTVHPPMVLGAMDQGLVVSALQSRRDEVRRCFEPIDTFPASITLRLELSSGGRVMGVYVLGSSDDMTVDACMSGVAARWVFPAPNAVGAELGVTFEVKNQSPKSPPKSAPPP